LRYLSKAQQREFLSLPNSNPGKQPFSGLIQTNALPLGPGSSIGGIFPVISRINHDCCPNTQHTWNSSIKQETIHAIRDIKAGEEIIISYNLGGPRQLWRERMKEEFKFDCACELCSIPTDGLRESDNRQVRMQLLDDAIGDAGRLMATPGEALADCRELLQLYRLEAITDARVARVCYDAFQICVMHSDQARASVFARMAYKTRVYLEGQDSPDTQQIKSFMANPANYISYGFSCRWNTPTRQIPKGLDGVEFNQWLWQRAENYDTSDSPYSDLGGSWVMCLTWHTVETAYHLSGTRYSIYMLYFHPCGQLLSSNGFGIINPLLIYFSVPDLSHSSSLIAGNRSVCFRTTTTFNIASSSL
jgi:hypothetical protein